jgi:transcriptional regulator with XRE-family HTH domain
MKPKKGANTLDALEWLDSVLPDSAQMRAIELEERTKYELAMALTRAREASGHTQSSLAEQLNVQQSLISKWEKVNHNHTLETLLHLCQATGAPLVLGLEIGGQFVPVTPAAERCVLLSEQTHTEVKIQADAVGVSTREVLLAPLVTRVKSRRTTKRTAQRGTRANRSVSP